MIDMKPYFKPIYLAHGDAAKELISEVADDLELDLSRLGQRKSDVLASFLYYAQSRDSEGLLIWPTGGTSQHTNAYSFYPAAGSGILKRVREALLNKGYLRNADERPSGIGDLTVDELNEFAGFDTAGLMKRPTTFQIMDVPLLEKKRLREASFIDAQRPYVLVNKPETYDEKRRREADGRRRTPRLSYSEVYRSELRRQAGQVQQVVRKMNAYWAEHPLTIPASDGKLEQLFASATRIFHNGNMRSGGRWYGAWTNYPQRERLAMQIDGEPVCEIDLNASQPSLFSLLTGVRMNTGDTWEDAYACVVDRLSIAGEAKLLRDKVKQVCVEMIGSGNAKRTGPAKDSDDEVSLFSGGAASLAEYTQIRDACLEVIPALKQLDSSYMNASGFLSYHEANILTETLLSLKKQDIPAYGVHDCVLVKASDQEAAVRTYRLIIQEYANRTQSKLNVEPLYSEVGLSIESSLNGKVKLNSSYNL